MSNKAAELLTNLVQVSLVPMRLTNSELHEAHKRVEAIGGLTRLEVAWSETGVLRGRG